MLSTAAFAGGGAVEGTVTVKRSGKPAFVKNTLVYIRGYATDAPAEPPELAQSGRAFDKVVLPVVKQSRVQFTNRELEGTLYHNVFTPGPEPKFASGKYRPGDKPFVGPKLTTEGPVTMFCDIHKEMIATIYVVPNDRYTLLATAEGDKAPFRIEGIKPGKWTVVAWHRSSKRPAEQEIEIVEGKTAKLDLVIDGDPKVEEALGKHARYKTGNYPDLKADGGAVGEAIGFEDKW